MCDPEASTEREIFSDGSGNLWLELRRKLGPYPGFKIELQPSPSKHLLRDRVIPQLL